MSVKFYSDGCFEVSGVASMAGRIPSARLRPPYDVADVAGYIEEVVRDRCGRSIVIDYSGYNGPLVFGEKCIILSTSLAVDAVARGNVLPFQRTASG